MRRGTKRKTTHKDAAPTQPDEEPTNGPSQSFQGSKDGPAEENHVEQPEREEPIQKDEVEKKVRDEPTKNVAKGKAKRAKTAKPEAEPEYFSEKRNLVKKKKKNLIAYKYTVFFCFMQASMINVRDHKDITLSSRHNSCQ